VDSRGRQRLPPEAVQRSATVWRWRRFGHRIDCARAATGSRLPPAPLPAQPRPVRLARRPDGGAALHRPRQASPAGTRLPL